MRIQDLTAGRHPRTAGPKVAGTDPLYPANALFPLGRPFGLIPPSDEVCPTDLLPFGIRQAVAGRPQPVGDLSAYGFDHTQQIGTVRDGEAVVPLMRHTDGQTRSVTRPDGQSGPDTDQDRRED